MAKRIKLDTVKIAGNDSDSERENTSARPKKDGSIDYPSELKKEKIESWVEELLLKLKRTSSRSPKCRLLESVERTDFENFVNAYLWQSVKFANYGVGVIFNDKGDKLEEFNLTRFQKIILEKDASLNDLIRRWEIKEETGDWQYDDEVKKKLISKGGEAIVLAEIFDGLELALRVQVFDPFLFTENFGAGEIFADIHLSKDYKPTKDKEASSDENQMPFHKNVIHNYVNIELFHEKDEDKEDCLGWITIMEKGEEDLRSVLKEEKIYLEKRRQIANEIMDGEEYLGMNCGIWHLDRKLENFLLVGGVPKFIDFGLVVERTGRKGYRDMGYARRGSKFKVSQALAAGTPGFAGHAQITNGDGYRAFSLYYFLFCDWKTTWTLLYKPINEEEENRIDELVKKCGASSIRNIDLTSWFTYSSSIRKYFTEVKKIISLEHASDLFCLDNPNLTRSCKMSCLKQRATKCVQQEMENLTENVFDQKNSQLCVPISVTTLLRNAIKNDLHFKDSRNQYSSENILATLTMIIFPRSISGLNLNPNEEEKEFQQNEIEILLQRVRQKTYLMKSGWEIIRKIGDEEDRPVESAFEYKEVTLNENFTFIRPATVSGAYLFPSGEILFHQMTMDRVENDEYVLQNTDFKDHSPVLRLPLKNPYYVSYKFIYDLVQETQTNVYEEAEMKMEVVNEKFGNMKTGTWYLLPQAHTIALTPIEKPVEEASSKKHVFEPIEKIKNLIDRRER